MASVADKFRGLPIEDLIVSPLIGISKGQAKLNDVTWQYINEIGFTVGKDGKTKEPNNIDVEINRYVNVDGQPEPQLQTLKSKVPLLPLIPLPALAVTTADIEFTMQVDEQSTHTDSRDTEVDTKAEVSYTSWWGLKASASMSGKVATHSQNTRKSDNSAKFDVKVHAEQLPPTEGMLKLSDALVTMIEPSIVNPSGNDGGGSDHGG